MSRNRKAQAFTVATYAILTTCALLALPAWGKAPAGDSSPSLPGTEFQIQAFVENDVLHRTDRYYTNGLKLGVGVRADNIPQPVNATFREVLDRLSDKADELHFGMFVGQSMYTPRDITIAAPQPFDRPWAGWLYLGLVGQRTSTGAGRGDKGPDTLDTLEIDVGVVGPASGAGDVQAWRHRQINSPTPAGWGNQLPNEPALLVAYLHKRRYGETNRVFDFIPHIGASVGTVMTFARAGGIVRFGVNKSGFGPDVIEPGGAMLQSTRQKYAKARGDSLEWFVFGGADLRVIAHNIFLDGTVFHASPSVDRRPIVYDILAGMSVRVGILRASVTRVMRSEEFTTARGGGGRQHFHSVNIGVEF